MSRNRVLALFCAAILLCLTSVALAQKTASPPEVRFTFNVGDPSHAWVPDAVLKILDEKGSLRGTLITDGRGGAWVSLPPGNYDVHASASGFQNQSVRISTKPERETNQLIFITLTVAGGGPIVDVTGSQPVAPEGTGASSPQPVVLKSGADILIMEITGAAVPHATVTIKDKRNLLVATLTTDLHGKCSIPLKAGEYSALADSEGYAEQRRRFLILADDTHLQTVRFMLQPGAGCSPCVTVGAVPCTCPTISPDY